MRRDQGADPVADRGDRLTRERADEARYREGGIALFQMQEQAGLETRGVVVLGGVDHLEEQVAPGRIGQAEVAVALTGRGAARPTDPIMRPRDRLHLRGGDRWRRRRQDVGHGIRAASAALLEIGLDLALELRRQDAGAVDRLSDGDPDPSFADAIFLDIGLLDAVETNADATLEKLGVVEEALRIRGKPVQAGYHSWGIRSFVLGAARRPRIDETAGLIKPCRSRTGRRAEPRGRQADRRRGSPRAR